MDQQYIQQSLLPLNYIDRIDEAMISQERELQQYLSASGKKPNTGYQQAGVLLPLVPNKENNHWDIILTRRAAHLKNHPGEISFPGGRFEQQDKNLQQTAKRETREEIGIPENKLHVIGRLPRQNTISQYQVTPFVAIVDAEYQLNIDKNEVEEAFLVPLAFVIDSSNQQLVSRKLNQQSFSYFVIQYNEYNIWGATARMLVNLGKRLNHTK